MKHKERIALYLSDSDMGEVGSNASGSNVSEAALNADKASVQFENDLQSNDDLLDSFISSCEQNLQNAPPRFTESVMDKIAQLETPAALRSTSPAPTTQSITPAAPEVTPTAPPAAIEATPPTTSSAATEAAPPTTPATPQPTSPKIAYISRKLCAAACFSSAAVIALVTMTGYERYILSFLSQQSDKITEIVNTIISR